MNKFSKLFSELNALEKIGTAALEEAKLAFSELTPEEQETEKANLETLEAKPVEEAPADVTTPAADPVTPPAEDTPPAGEALQASEQVDAAVFKETGLNLTQIKEMQKQFNEMAKAAKFAETEKKVDAFVFSEANKDGVILPKAKNKIAEFASKLPDAMANEFFEILGSKAFKTIELGEIGKDGTPSGGSSFEFSIPSTTPTGVTRESFVLDFVAKEFQSKETGLKYEDALFKASAHIRENGIK